MKDASSHKLDFSGLSSKLVYVLIVSFLCLKGYSQTYKENFQMSTSGLDRAPWTLTAGTNNDVTVQGRDMGTDNCTIVQDPTNSSNKVMKVDKKIPPSGHWYNNNTSREEIMYLGKASQIPGGPPEFAPWYTPVSYRWKFYFTGDHDWDDDDNSPITIGQWHHSQLLGGIPPPATLRVKGNDLTFRARWTSNQNPSRSNIDTRDYTLKRNLKKNKWYYIIVDITWDYRDGRTGMIKAYLKEGEWPSKKNEVLDHSGGNVGVGYNFYLTGYAQVGGYFWPWRESQGVERSRSAGVKKFEFLIDDWEYTVGEHSFGSGSSNDPPTADAGPDRDITLPKNDITLNGSGDDPDGSIVDYDWTQVSGPSNANLKKEHTANCEISNLKQGVYIFRLTVTDNDGSSDSDDVKVTVNEAPNQDPVAKAGPNKTVVLPDDRITINGSATDSDGTIESYRWTQKSGPSNATLSGEDTPDLTASNLEVGTYVFQLKVIDDDGAQDTDGVSVVVEPAPNQDPVADAGSNKHVTLPTNQITINGSGTDSDGNITDYKWVQSNGPNNATLNGVDTPDLTASDLVEGTYVFRLTVTDNNGAEDDDGMQVIVHPAAVNESPSANAGPNRTITLPDNSIIIKGSGEDTDGSIASYSWSQTSGPTSATLTDVDKAHMTASSLVQGRYVFTLTVTDNLGASDEDEMHVVVKSISNQAPTANAGANQTINLPKNSVTLPGLGYDPDGEITSYQWAQVSGPVVTLIGTNTIDLEIKDLIEGVLVFELTVTDNAGVTDTDEVKVTVLAAPPSISAEITHATCSSNDGSIRLTLTGGKGPFTYRWSTGTANKDLGQLPKGNYDVTVTDGNGNSISKSFTVNSVQADLQIDAAVTNATCSDNNGSIEVAVIGGTGPYTFEWSSLARTSSLNQLSEGSYNLVVTDQNGCQKKFSFEVGVDAEEKEFELYSNVVNSTCAGNDGSISLEVVGGEATGPYSYAWEHGAEGPDLFGLPDGKYTVTITNQYGCFMNSEFTVNQDPGLAKPTITQVADSLHTDQEASSYQWFLDDIAIDGADQRSIKISSEGSYTVRITTGSECSASSDYFYAKDPPPGIYPGNQSFTMQQVDIYPNPAVNDINVRLIVNEPAATSITIYDLMGRVMETHDLGIVNFQITENLRIDQYPTGTFLVRVKANQEIVNRRIIKQR